MSLAACGSTTQGTTSAGDTAQQANADSGDPWENTNRAIFDFNNSVDRAVLQPIARAYRDVLHEDIRDGIRNFSDNINEPVNFVNLVLQGKDVKAAQTVIRFVINSTVGIGGLGDVATNLGYPRHQEDFGQTLAVWGVGEGPYIMLPILGPSNVRDTVGKVADNFTDPFGYVIPLAGNLARTFVNGVDRRERNLETLEDIERNSLDFYAAVRSLYRQNRESQVRDGEVEGPVLDIPVYAE
ncbi:MAG: VacJ family lipoprotein [Alphaproteobacteria bacterium]|nr:VacJ family lipoprotein [Alphaproteobacteria bacterium]